MKVRFQAVFFWVCLVALAIVVGYAAYWDTRRDPTQCGREGSTFLVLNELDTGAREIKALLYVTDFAVGEDRLRVDSVTEGPDEDTKSRKSLLSTLPGTPEAGNVWQTVKLPYESQSFFYPFEEYIVNLRIDLRKGTNRIPLNLQVTNYIDELILDPCIDHYSFEKAATGVNTFSIRLRRHRFVRAIAVILYSVALLFLFYISTREETSKVLSNSLGYIAALWGIRQIIVGYARLFPTIIDFATLALYVAVIAIVAYKWLLGPPGEKRSRWQFYE